MAKLPISDSKETIILLHSLGTSGDMWSPVTEILTDRFTVLRPDSRGHGKNTAGPITQEAWVEDIAEIVDGLPGHNIHLVGLSMGGVQALGFAQAYPERIKSLTLANTFAVLDEELAAAKIEQMRQDIRTSGMPEYASTYLDGTLTRPIAPRLRKVLQDSIASMSGDAYMDSASATFTADFSADLPSMTVPTLVITSALDKKTPLALSEFMHQQIQGSQLVSIPEAGHLSSVEQPSSFASVLSGFIGSIGSATRERTEQAGVINTGSGPTASNSGMG